METISDVKNAIQSLKKMRTTATRAAARGLAWQHLLLPPALPSIRSLLSFLLDLDVVAPSLSLSAKSPPSSLSRTTTESTLALSGTAAALASFLSPSVAIIEAVVREFSKWVKVGEQGEGEGEGGESSGSADDDDNGSPGSKAPGNGVAGAVSDTGTGDGDGGLGTAAIAIIAVLATLVVVGGAFAVYRAQSGTAGGATHESFRDIDFGE
uniref:Uncharacterized protein n=1 Tax=Sexangularia sp. CB-2014 TaxID=1486929 RepID=A0A7S1V2L2_9EUKA|mmetsp:Transcript_10478/g.33160  ORF Transcript_10478/g.33160 Transcript_10478/m.33160 type:complete len:210 (+) Transcript_10478:99-728(+)